MYYDDFIKEYLEYFKITRVKKNSQCITYIVLNTIYQYIGYDVWYSMRQDLEPCNIEQINQICAITDPQNHMDALNY